MQIDTQITNPSAAADYRSSRPKRQQLDLLRVNAAVGFGISITTISLAERG